MAPFAPPRIIIAGPPGSGKSTQGIYISQQLGLIYISVDEMINGSSSKNPNLNIAVFVSGLLADRINGEDCVKNGWLLDGFPQTQEELNAFQGLDIECDAFIYLDVPQQVLLKRFRRVQCTVAGKILSATQHKTIKESTEHNSFTEHQTSAHIKKHYDNFHIILSAFHSSLLHIKGDRKENFVSDEILLRLRRKIFQNVTFVVGGPSTGKKTHCGLISENNNIFVHLSPKDLIRQEQYFDTKLSNEIDRITSRGMEIPSSTIVELLQAAMSKSSSKHFIIDSFPRNSDDLDYWYKNMSNKCQIDFLINLSCPMASLRQRLAVQKDATGKTSVASLAKKHKLFSQESSTYMNGMSLYGRVREVSTMPPVEVAHKRVSSIMHSLSLIAPYERCLCIVRPKVVQDGHIPSLLSSLHQCRLVVIYMKFVCMNEEVAHDFFVNHSGGNIQREKWKHWTSGPSLFMIVEGSDIIRVLLALIGKTKEGENAEASPLQLQYGIDVVPEDFYCSTSEYRAINDFNYWMRPNDISSKDSFPLMDPLPMEDTMAMIKPVFSESHYNDIMSIVTGHGFEVVAESHLSLSKRCLLELYPEIDENADDEQIKYMLSGPVVILKLRRCSALKSWRHLMGDIDLDKARNEQFDSIRGIFSRSFVENVVHGSFNGLQAAKELKYFFPSQDPNATVTDSTSSKSRPSKKIQKPSGGLSPIKRSAMHVYLTQDVSPVLNDLVKNIAIKKPKDVMGYAINDLLEKQKLDMIGADWSRSSSTSSLSVLPSISDSGQNFDAKSVGESNSPTSMEMAHAQIQKLQETIHALSANIFENSDSPLAQSSPLPHPVAVHTEEHKKKVRSLHILSFGDLVGFGNSYEDVLRGNTVACLKGLIKNFSASNPMVIFTGGFLGCFDNIDSTHYSSMFSLIDNLGVSYGILGNRDFEYGFDDVHGHLKFSSITWIISNISASQQETRLSNIEEKVFVEWNGVQVGLIGLVDDWVSLVPSSRPNNVKVKDPIETAKRLILELKEEGAEVVVAITHCKNQAVNETLSALPGIDAVVGGHVKGFRSWRNKKDSVGVSSGGLEGVAKMTIKVEEHMPASVEWPPQFAIVENIKQPFDVIDSIMSKLREEVTEISSITIGSLDGDMFSAKRNLLRSSEASIGSLVTDMMRQYFDCSIAVLNAGAFGEIDHREKFVTLGDISKMLPRHDTVALVHLKGRCVLEMLNNGVSRAPSADGRFLQVSGVSFEFKTDSSLSERCCNVKIGGQTLDPDHTYSCAVPQWMVDLHDGYKCFANIDSGSREFNPSLLHIVHCFFRSIKNGSLIQGSDEDHFEAVKPPASGRIRLSNCKVSDKVIPSLLRSKSQIRISKTVINNNLANPNKIECSDDESADEMEGIDYDSTDLSK